MADSSPNFHARLDKRQHELADVISDYSFDLQCACGLSACRKRHFSGYWVRTIDGLETNVGHVCGRNHFGEKFEVKARENTARRDREDLLAQANRIKAHAPQLRQRIFELNRGRFGIKWANVVRRKVNELLGDGLFQSLLSTARRGELAVTQARARENEEIDEMLARSTGRTREQLRYETVDAGTLAPMPWLDFDFLGRLRAGLLVPLNEFDQLDLESLSSPKLRAQVKRFDGADNEVASAEQAIATIPIFLTSTNLETLSRWIPTHASAKRTAVQEWIGSRPFKDLLQGWQG